MCCTLATSTFLRSSRGSSPWAASPTTKSNTRGFGIGRRSLAKNVTLGDRFRTLCDSLVTSREVTHATTSPAHGKWLVRAIQSLKSGMSRSGTGAISSKREQFWGRAVQASRDSLDPGRFLFCGEVSEDSQSFRTFALAHILNYFPMSFVTVGTSSLFPDDKLW
jgi:hypothetical protein